MWASWQLNSGILDSGLKTPRSVGWEVSVPRGTKELATAVPSSCIGCKLPRGFPVGAACSTVRDSTHSYQLKRESSLAPKPLAPCVTRH